MITNDESKVTKTLAIVTAVASAVTAVSYAVKAYYEAKGSKDAYGKPSDGHGRGKD